MLPNRPEALCGLGPAGRRGSHAPKSATLNVRNGCWRKGGANGARRQLPVQCSLSPTGATYGSTVKMPNNPGQEIRWGCALSRATSLPVAIREAVNKVLKSIGGPEAKPELAIVFVSSIHGADFEQVIPILRELVPSLKHVFGCSGYGIVGGGQDGPVEVEGEPGFSLTLGSIPGADIQVLHTLRSSIPAADATPEEWADFVGVPHDTQRPVSFLTFADPRFAQVRDMVGGLDYAFPNSPKIGAILSSGTRSRSRAMFAWSATPRKQRRQLGERLEGRDSTISSSRDYYLRQARAEAKSTALKPRPSMPLTTLAEDQGEDGPATAALQAQQQGRTQPAGKDNNGSSSSTTSSSSSTTSNSTDAGSVGTGMGIRGETSGRDPRAPPAEPIGTSGDPGTPSTPSSSSSSSSSTSSTSTQQQQQQQSGDQERMKAGGGGGGAGVLGELFNRFVRAPLGGLGQARKQQQDAQIGESRGSSSRENVSSSSSGQDSKVAQGSSASVPSASANSAAAAMPESSRVSSGSGTSTSSSSSVGDEGSGGGVGTAAQSSSVSSSDRASSNGGPSSSDRVVSTFKSFFGRSPLPIGQASRAGVEEEDAGEGNQGGVYMYGAILLALHGDVVLDTVTSMGYRAPSPCIWRIEGVTSKNEIVSIAPEALDNGSEGMGSKGSFLGRGGQGSGPRSSLLEDSSDEDDDEELSAIFESTKPEVQAITAVVDMLDGLGEDSVDSWNELLDGAAVAIASDSSKRTSELGPDDWELLPLVDILEEYGVLKVGGSPVLGGGCDLRPGHRLRLMVRDTQGIKDGITDSMLRYKRNDLGAMMSGNELPPTFGTLLLTDVDRGIECYQVPNFESRTAHTYVPAPLAGIFGGAQIGPLKSGPGGGNGATGILENSAVLGVLRAATDKSPAAVKRQAGAKAQVVRQQQQQQEQRDAATSGSSSSSSASSNGSLSSRDRSSSSKEEEDGKGKEGGSNMSEDSKPNDAGEGGPSKRAN